MQKIDYEARLAFRGAQLESIGVAADNAKDELAGYTLGCLLLRHRADQSDPGAINREQHDAGHEWAKTVRRHAAVMGFKLSTPSPSFTMVSGMGGSGAEPNEDEIMRVRRNYRRCYDALMEASRDHGHGVWRVTYGICVEDWPAQSLQMQNYGELRVGLNALRRVL